MTATGPIVTAGPAGPEGNFRIQGFRSGCGFRSATWGLRCPRCGDAWTDAELASTGTVVSFTVQNVPSEEFLGESPYAYVIVALDGGGQVSGWIAGIGADDRLSIGRRVRAASTSRSGIRFEPEAPTSPGPG